MDLPAFDPRDARGKIREQALADYRRRMLDAIARGTDVRHGYFSAPSYDRAASAGAPPSASPVPPPPT